MKKGLQFTHTFVLAVTLVTHGSHAVGLSSLSKTNDLTRSNTAVLFTAQAFNLPMATASRPALSVLSHRVYRSSGAYWRQESQERGHALVRWPERRPPQAAWPAYITRLYKEGNVRELAVQLYAVKSARASSAAAALEALMYVKDTSVQASYLLDRYLADLPPGRSLAPLGMSTFEAAQKILATDGLSHLVYERALTLMASLTLPKMGRRFFPTPQTVDLLSTSPNSKDNFLAQKILANIVMSHAHPDIPPGLSQRAYRLLDSVFLTPGQPKKVYGNALVALQSISDDVRSRFGSGSVSEVVLGLPLALQYASMEHFEIFTDPYFRKVTQKMTISQAYAVSQAVYRLLDRHRALLSADSRRFAIDFMVAKLSDETVVNRIWFGPGVATINIAHQDEEFQLSLMEAMEKRVGVRTERIRSFKGSKQKKGILASIARSRGPLTIYFNGHGGTNHIWLREGAPGADASRDLWRPDAISYVELADALVQRTDLQGVSLLLDSCLSFNFTVQLLNRLERRMDTSGLLAVSTSDFGRNSQFSTFENQLTDLSRRAAPIRTRDLMDASHAVMVDQDAAFFAPLPASQFRTVESVLGPPVLDRGSTPREGQDTRAASSSAVVRAARDQSVYTRTRGSPKHLTKAFIQVNVPALVAIYIAGSHGALGSGLFFSLALALASLFTAPKVLQSSANRALSASA